MNVFTLVNHTFFGAKLTADRQILWEVPQGAGAGEGDRPAARR